MRVKTDKVDARVLADLLAADLIPRLWIGDERVRTLQRLVSRRRGLVKRRSQVKNEISAVLHRNVKRQPPASDLFGVRGRAWLAAQELPADECLTVDGCLRQLDFLSEELAQIDRLITTEALADTDVRRLTTIPGIDVTTAITLVAVIGDVSRFPSARHLVGYLGLHPRVRQSGNEPARHGRLSKGGSAAARHALVEAAWVATRSPGPLRAFAVRVGARRGRHIAADYAFQRPSLMRRKLRRLELAAGQHASSAAPGRTPSGRQAVRQPSVGSPSKPNAPTSGSSPTGRRSARRRVRARKRGAHHMGPRGAKPRGRPDAPEARTSARRHPHPRATPTKERATGKAV